MSRKKSVNRTARLLVSSRLLPLTKWASSLLVPTVFSVLVTTAASAQTRDSFQNITTPQIEALQQRKDQRTPAQAKIDSALLDHARQLRWANSHNRAEPALEH